MLQKPSVSCFCLSANNWARNNSKRLNLACMLKSNVYDIEFHFLSAVPFFIWVETKNNHKILTKGNLFENRQKRFYSKKPLKNSDLSSNTRVPRVIYHFATNQRTLCLSKMKRDNLIETKGLCLWGWHSPPITFKFSSVVATQP